MQWLAPSYHLCEVVYQTALEHVLKLVGKHFAEFGQGLLERQARYVLFSIAQNDLGSVSFQAHRYEAYGRTI